MTKKSKREPVVPREVLRAFIKDYKLQTAEDVQNALKDMFADTLQEMPEAEMGTTLGYEKYDVRTRISLSILRFINRFFEIVFKISIKAERVDEVRVSRDFRRN